MCGHITQFYTWAEVHKAMRLLPYAPNLRPRYNIAPTTTIDVVVAGDGERSLMPMRWGLVPEWWKKSLKDVPATFSARRGRSNGSYEDVPFNVRELDGVIFGVRTTEADRTIVSDLVTANSSQARLLQAKTKTDA